MALLASSARINECTRENFRGMPYQELWCLYPRTDFLYSEFEMSTNEDWYPDHLIWVQRNPAVPFIAVACYVAFIIIGPALMKNRDPFNFRKGMVCAPTWCIFIKCERILVLELCDRYLFSPYRTSSPLQTTAYAALFGITHVCVWK